jgi:hypothetical protein
MNLNFQGIFDIPLMKLVLNSFTNIRVKFNQRILNKIETERRRQKKPVPKVEGV